MTMQFTPALPRRRHKLSRAVNLFAAFALLGWCWEVLVELLATRAYVNRGFLSGPYLPIYGFGVLGIAAVWGAVENRLPQTGTGGRRDFAVFTFSACLASLAEWWTGWAMERLFHRRWWDYSRYPLNLDGRICLYSAVLLGVGGLLGVRLLLPRLNRLMERVPSPVENYLALLLSSVISLDLIHTLSGLT